MIPLEMTAQDAESAIWSLCNKLQCSINSINSEREAEDRRCAYPEFKRSAIIWTDVIKYGIAIANIANCQLENHFNDLHMLVKTK